jgi:putative membrane protein
MTSSRTLIVAAAAAALLGSQALAQGTAGSSTERDKAAGKEKSAQLKGKLAKQDRDALSKLAQSDLAEVQAGKLAQQKASSPEVKKFGAHMVQEHTKMLEEGAKVAQSKGVTPPKSPDKKHQEALNKLKDASGEDFDRRYMAQMVEDHQDALRLAEKAAKDAKDPEVKAHAEKGVPHIKEHLADARKLYSSLAASAGATRPPSKKQ